MPGQWLSVTEAVAYCARHGLNRNIKTIRRWAERSLKRPDDAEVKVREQDTGFGFRYMIEQSSLDLKIGQELDFEAKQKRADTSGHDQARPDMPRMSATKISRQSEETVWTCPDMTGQTRTTPAPQAAGAQHRRRLSEEPDEGEGRPDRRAQQAARTKDDQIMTMLERDRETNILIRGLQNTVANILQLKPPTLPRQRRRSDRRRDPGDTEEGRIEMVDNVDQPDDRLGV